MGGGQISSSFFRHAAGKGHTRCLASVTWCLTHCATSEISLVDGTGATTAHVARIAWQAKTAVRGGGVNPVVARGVQGEPELGKGGNPKILSLSKFARTVFHAQEQNKLMTDLRK